MAETDVFNPTNWLAAGLVFNPNPSYGFSRKMGSNRQVQRPRLGIYPSRESMNGGHIFSLSWYNTDITTAERIVAFYHQFKSGYFTLIDQDWNQRQYVGRFMNEPELGHPANGKYTLQGVVFEEMPQARMLSYPTVALYGHVLNVVDDYLNPLVALMQGNWAIQVSPVAGFTGNLTMPSSCEAFNAAPAVGDWAQIGYVGFGFQITFRIAATLGSVTISLDDVVVVGSLDLSTGASSAVAATATVIGGGVNYQIAPSETVIANTAVVTVTNVPLDQHRIKIAYEGVGADGGTSIIFPQVVYVY